VLLARGDGTVLLQHRDDIAGIAHPGKWAIPGGRIEGPETPLAAARRELLEETGYSAARLRPLRRDTEERDGILHERHLFWAPYDSVQPITCREGQEMRWLSPAEALARPLVPSHAKLLADLPVDVVAHLNSRSADDTAE